MIILGITGITAHRSTIIDSLLGKDRFFSIPLATAIGIPVYTSGVGAIPIVEGLLKSGMSHGAALAFLVAGPVTTIPAMTAVFAYAHNQPGTPLVSPIVFRKNRSRLSQAQWHSLVSRPLSYLK